MLPTAMPMIIAFTRMQSFDRKQLALFISVLIFSGGYIASWAVFSVAATLLQAGLTDLAYLSAMAMKIISGPVAGGILILAGFYQFTPLKQSCLRQCRSPISFLMTQWREGYFGAFVMGAQHGLFCVGCCWALMGLLFVTGVMNIVWIVVITGYVLIEKLVPFSHVISKCAGLGMIGTGLWFIVV